MRKDKKEDNKGAGNKARKQEEQLSRRDIEELMGIHAPRYHRVKGGAIRQK